MTTTKLALPGQFANNNGKGTILGWTLFGLTVTAFIYTIYQNHLEVAKLKADELTRDTQAKKIAELEVNLKTALGSRYKTAS